VGYREPPDNDHDALMALWHAVIGTNGGGIIERIKRIEERPRARWFVVKDILVSGGIVAIILERLIS